MKVLVIGGYGLIGRSVCRGLLDAEYEVVGLGRSLAKGEATALPIAWRIADLNTLLTKEEWKPLLTDIEIVVNCAGVLQDGLGDDVAKVQRDAVVSLVAACEERGVHRLLQISAPGVSTTSDTQFYRTKAQADAAVKDSRLDWTILRPGLVLAPHAYGGTSLIRMLAATPWVLPVVYGDTRIQTVVVEDVVDAVGFAMEGKLSGRDVDLVEDEPHRLDEIIKAYREWMGWKPVYAVIETPHWFGRVVGRCADFAGWLGWRSAMRSTSMKVLGTGVCGDPEPFRKVSGRSCSSLEKTLAHVAPTAQDRLHARSMLAFPILLGLLSAFWILSGIIGLMQHDAAQAVLGDAMSPRLSKTFVSAGGLADIAIGAAMLVRPWCKRALWASIGLALAYLAGGTLFTPHIWIDPLGPFVKVFPAMGLAVAVHLMHPER